MKLQDFNYSLPNQLIAQFPLRKREKARLMVIDRKQKKITHDFFFNISRYLPPKSTLVLNDSKVVPARLLGHKQRTGGQVEIFLLKKLFDEYTYEALFRPVRRLKYHDRIVFGKNGFYAEIMDKRTVRFNKKNVTQQLNRIGHVPLPPYIKRSDRAIDRIYYQTVYAKKTGSVAAPTAGLHFTKKLLTQLKKQGHAIEKVTLHINYATFKPVEETDITKHKMYSEIYTINPKMFGRLQRHKKEGRKIVAVGTTSCRVLESTATTKKLNGETNLFIYPGYRFRLVDHLLTNFHLPLSTLLMLVSAFGGHDLIRKAYRQAIQEKYRFYSYGDAMLIL